ncbi:hypothetical protein M3G00_07925 [Brevibacterium casei]|uniref:hypothetical protein n=1 Tax=Brevibacterium casei TaxID=33889 RepID=UPI00223BDB94|nr:hypothetical protein [Brevibacterium casei]MCT2182863.1 hypothetical protein [Brevibacterium casei]
MSENKYTAADFAAAEFAKRPNGDMAARLDPEDTLPWRVVNGRGLWSWFNDYDMAEEGWVPVPSSPAKPTITAGEVGRRSHLVRGDNVETPSLVDFLEALGIEVVPDPVPSNAERLAKMLRQAWDRTTPFESPTEQAEGLAVWLDDRGVTVPGGEGREQVL